jgi:two-component system phosphate regulon sensor histidine kinase PhoR
MSANRAAWVLGALAGAGVVAVPGILVLLLTGHNRAWEWSLLAITATGAILGAQTGRQWLRAWNDRLSRLHLGGEGEDPGQWPGLLRSLRPRIDRLRIDRDLAIATQGQVRHRLDAIVSGLRDGVLVIDPDLNIASINAAAATMLGSRPELAVRRPLPEIARDFDLVRVTGEAIASGIEQATPIDYRRGGRQLDVRVLPIEQGGQRLAILVVQDVTEVRQLEGIRRDFVANVSHELRTPLAGIRALVETLADGALDDPSVSHVFLDRVVAEVDRLNELIEDLLDLGRLESGRFPLRRSVENMRVIADRSIERVAHHAEPAEVTIEADFPANLPPVHVDASRIEQVLVNLLTNAIRFSHSGDRVVVSAQSAGDAVCVAVQDFGLGILPDDLPRVFERFYKAERARTSTGTGLGLAIAKHIVQAHGGTISAESEYGRGSTFRFTVPVATDSAPT